MTHFYILVLSLLCFTNVYSQGTEGYLLTNDNDTLYVKIKLPSKIFGGISSFKFHKEVEIIDSGGITKVYTPKDLRGFGFATIKSDYKYFSKPIDSDTYYFLEPVIIGKKASLFQYNKLIHYYNGSSNQFFYTFENEKGEHLHITNFAKLTDFRDKLETFYKDCPGIFQIMLGKFQNRRHIPRDINEIIERINNYKSRFG